MKSVWIVVPAYNESSRIDQTLIGLKASGYHNIVVVDDGSHDGTAETAAKCDVWILRHLLNRGQGAALVTGISFARSRGADIIVTFDSDNQHDSREIESVIAPILNGETDVVLGSRVLGDSSGAPLSRRMLLYLGTMFTRLTTGMKVTDTHNGFRAFAVAALNKIVIAEDRMAHASEILSQIAKNRLRWKEVPVTIRYSEETLAKGQSNMDAFKILMRLIVARIVR